MALDRDWRTHFEDHYQRASHPDLHIWQMLEEGAHGLLRYQCWFMKICMTSVYLQGDYGADLRNRIENTYGYAPNGRTWTRQVRKTGILYLWQMIYKVLN